MNFGSVSEIVQGGVVSFGLNAISGGRWLMTNRSGWLGKRSANGLSTLLPMPFRDELEVTRLRTIADSLIH